MDKKITDLQLRSSVTDELSIPSDDGIQSYRVTAEQIYNYAVAKAAAMFVPAGALMPFAGTAAPTGFLLCYGQSLLRADYSALFTAIGTTYGAADGTHFNLPDLRGRVAAGKDDMGGSSANRLIDAGTGSLDGDVLGDTGGAETVTLTSAEMPTHTHTQTAHGHAVYGATGSGGFTSVGNGSARGVAADSSATGLANVTTAAASGQPFVQQTTAVNQNTGGGGAHNNVQPTIILNYIIKT